MFCKFHLLWHILRIVYWVFIDDIEYLCKDKLHIESSVAASKSLWFKKVTNCVWKFMKIL